MALLTLLLEVRPQFDLDLIVAHLNHNLRGNSSDEDQEFVRTLADRAGVRFISEKIPTQKVVERKGSLENWAREQRYAFLSETAAGVHAQKVGLGHTMNDQAETLLMRLLRGSGTAGMSGMSPRRDVFIRPLLTIEHREVLEYLELRGVDWREDDSNLDTRFLRNKLRGSLIPSLRDYNPRIVQVLAGTATILREENEALQYWARDVFDRAAILDRDTVNWDVDFLVSLPSGLQKRLVFLSLERLLGRGYCPSASDVASIINLLREGASGKLAQTERFRCLREFNRVRFETAPLDSPAKFCYPLPIPGRIALPQTGTCFEARLEPSPHDAAVLNRWELFLSHAELEAGFCVRNWEPADIYSGPCGATPRRVAEMLAEKKIPRRSRASWPVVILTGKIVCISDFPTHPDMSSPERTRVVVEERGERQ